MTPPRSTFSASPATVTIGRRNGPEVWIGNIVSWSQDPGAPYVLLEVAAMGEVRWFPCTTLEEDTAGGDWTGELWSESGQNVFPVKVRRTVESDAVNSITMEGTPNVPIPVEVIASIHASQGIFTVPTLYAMSDDEGFVATMMLNTDDGLYVRYGSNWHKLQDADVVDGLTVDEVDDASLDLFDQFDRAGQMVHVSVMSKDGQAAGVRTPAAPEPGEPPRPAPAVTAAAVSPRDVPVLASIDDLDAAISEAAANPDLRWYVERRARALGFTAEFPWN